MEKQIYAALEIADHEVRLILGEFFNTRFNVLKTERAECECFEKKANSNGLIIKIKDKKEVTKTIKKVIENASNNLGSQIENVLLCIPSFDIKREPLSLTEENQNYDKLITHYEIGRTLKKAMQSRNDDNYAFTNAVCSKFTDNKTTSRRVPFNKKCDEYSVLIDLYMANRKLTYDLVSCVEDAECKVLDISLDVYAIAKELSLFEQNMEQNVVVVKLEQETTTIAYFSDNRLISSKIIDNGFLKWGLEFSIKQHIPKNVVASIILNNANFENNCISENIVYLWSENNVKHALSEKQLSELLNDGFNEWCEMIADVCMQSKDSKNKVILTGEGASIDGIDSVLQNKFDLDIKKYIPDTLGARTPALISCLGMFYAYSDQEKYFARNENSINMAQFKKSIGIIPEEENQNQETEGTSTGLTGKIKNIWFDFTAKKGKED